MSVGHRLEAEAQPGSMVHVQGAAEGARESVPWNVCGELRTKFPQVNNQSLQGGKRECVCVREIKSD